MRKRVLLSLILLILVLSLSVFSFMTLQSRFSALGEALHNAVYADAPAEDSCREIAACWKSCADVTQIFLLHSDLTELRTALESLPDLTSDPLIYRAACIRSLHLLSGIRDSLYPSIENIL